MSARVTHYRLGEIGGKHYLLCDTRGNNLSSTVSFEMLNPDLQCRRCVNRWNKLAHKANRRPDVMSSLLNIELTDKFERNKSSADKSR